MDAMTHASRDTLLRHMRRWQRAGPQDRTGGMAVAALYAERAIGHRVVTMVVPRPFTPIGLCAAIAPHVRDAVTLDLRHFADLSDDEAAAATAGSPYVVAARPTLHLVLRMQPQCAAITLEGIEVHVSHRGQGWYRRLVEAFHDVAGSLGIRVCVLRTSVESERLRALLDKHATYDMYDHCWVLASCDAHPEPPSPQVDALELDARVRNDAVVDAFIRALRAALA